MNPLAGLFLALACLLGIAATGSVFELAYGEPDLGVTATRWILAVRRHFVRRSIHGFGFILR